MDLYIPQKKESAVEVVINNIKRLLLTKKLLPGDKLPNETELAINLAVSRGSIREAMKIFSAFGIVEIRQGDGTYIAKSAGKSLFDPLLFSLILSEPDIDELAEFRQIMEIEVIKLIIKNATSEDIKKIESVYNDMEKKISDGETDPSILAKCDLDFHAALANATENRLVEKTYTFILDFFSTSIENTHKNQISGQVALNTHKEILDSLLEKNLDKAINSIEKSVDVWKDLLSIK